MTGHQSRNTNSHVSHDQNGSYARILESFEPFETLVLWCEAVCLHLVLIKPPSTTSIFNPPRSFSRSPLLEYYRLRTLEVLPGEFGLLIA